MYIIGAGGHTKVVIDTLRANGERITGVVDDNVNLLGKEISGVQVLGTTDLLAEKSARAIIAIGDNIIRKKIAERFTNLEWACAVHPRAYVAPSAKLQQGTVVFAGAVVQPETRVGRHSIINTAASIDHDCQLGDWVHVAPGSHLAGNVMLDTGVFVGIGGCIIPSCKVGKWSTVGAGATVIEDVPSRVTVVGTPARILE